jgi:hypothetical protein
MWIDLSSSSPDLFERLRACEGWEISLRARHGTGNGRKVEVPSASIVLQGTLRVQAAVDRFAVDVPGWGSDDFAWLARRKGRGGPDYWQGAIEYRCGGRPALVVYFTAPAEGIQLRVRDTHPDPAISTRSVSHPDGR